jgi:hypothetical protein
MAGLRYAIKPFGFAARLRGLDHTVILSRDIVARGNAPNIVKETKYENELESGFIVCRRCRVAGISRDGEDNATPASCTVDHKYPERRARVRRHL